MRAKKLELLWPNKCGWRSYGDRLIFFHHFLAFSTTWLSMAVLMKDRWMRWVREGIELMRGEMFEEEKVNLYWPSIIFSVIFLSLPFFSTWKSGMDEKLFWDLN